MRPKIMKTSPMKIFQIQTQILVFDMKVTTFRRTPYYFCGIIVLILIVLLHVEAGQICIVMSDRHIRRKCVICVRDTRKCSPTNTNYSQIKNWKSI